MVNKLREIGIMILLITSLSYGEVKTPEEIGPQVFKILQTLDTASLETHLHEFLSYENFIKLTQDTTKIKQEFRRKKVTNISREDLKKEYSKTYYKQINRGKKYNIIWHDIEYITFEFKSNSVDGMSLIEGKLYLSYGSMSYRVKTTYLLFENALHLVEIENISTASGKKKKNDPTDL